MVTDAQRDIRVNSEHYARRYTTTLKEEAPTSGMKVLVI